MRTKNLTPFPFGCKVCSRTPPQPEMTVVVRGSFHLAPGQPLEPFEEADQGAMTSEVFDEEDSERLGECRYPNDFADFKPRADLLLRGSCHTPGEKPLPACPVIFTVGKWSKEVLAIGQRTWKKGLMSDSMSDPEPFTAMPLSFANSFGGPGYTTNPVGKGFDGVEPPNVEYPDRLVRSTRDKPPPACYGPINPAWAPRAAKVGKKYGESWKRKRSPFYSEDFDWTHFNAAPDDQQLPTYLRGDEKLKFTNLHPEAAELKTQLPGLRIRVFVKDVSGRFREVSMNLDTLFVDLDEGRLYLTWRGLDKVADQELLDVSVMLIDSERLSDAPRPVEEYRAALDAFEKDPLGMEDQPQEVQAAQAALDVLKADEAGAGSGDDEGPALDKVAKLIGTLAGALHPELAAVGQEGVARFAAAAKNLDTDIDGPLKQAMARKAGPPPVVGGTPNVRLGDAMGKVAAMAKKVRAAANSAGVTVPNLDKLDAVLGDPRLKEIDPALDLGNAPETTKGEPNLEPGGDLSGQDLRERDLKGADLRGANLEGADLSGANLSGAQLQRANLKYARLAEADLGGADLTEADLTMADAGRALADGAVFAQTNLDRTNLADARLAKVNLVGANLNQTVLDGANVGGAICTGARLSQVVMSRVQAREIDFHGATLDQVVFDQADLTSGVLTEVKAKQCVFDETNLTDANFQRAELCSCLASKATLERADFSKATLEATFFGESKAAGLDLTEAKLSKSSFGGSDLSRASFSRASGDGVILIDTILDDADFIGANLTDSHFMQARGQGTKFSRANLRGSRLHRTKFDRAEFIEANLFGADFSKSDLANISFRNSNLYDSKFPQATINNCFFTGANLDRAQLEQ